MSFKDPSVPPDIAIVRYERRDFGEVLIPVAGLNPVIDNSELKSRVSFALLWLMPSVGDGRGNLQSLVNSKITLMNDSSSSLKIRIAKPLGFVSDPMAIAAWEVLGSTRGEITLKSGALNNFSVHHVVSDFVVPRRLFVDGKEYLHIASVSAAYEIIESLVNKTGGAFEVIPAGVGLSIKIETTYVSGGGVSAAHESFIIRAYSDDKHMNVVNSAPADSISLGQLRGPNGQIENVQLYNTDMSGDLSSIKERVTPVYMRFLDKDGTETNNVEGLDTSETYLLSSAIPAHYFSKSIAVWTTGNYRYDKSRDSIASYISYLKPNNGSSVVWKMSIGNKVVQYAGHAGWYLFVTPGAVNFSKPGEGGEAFMRVDTIGEYTGAFPDAVGLMDAVQFTPVREYVAPVSLRKRRGKPVIYKSMTIRKDQLLELDWKDTVVKAASVVVKVLKTALAVAGVLGLAEVTVVGTQ